MSKLVKQIKGDTIQAMKSKDKEKLSTLRLLVAELEKEKIENKLAEVEDLTNEQVETVISRQIKKLDKEIEAYVAVNRTTERQEIEKELLIGYLPKQLTDEEIQAEISHAVYLVNRGEIKNPMQYLSTKLKGRADMKLVMKLAKERS